MDGRVTGLDQGVLDFGNLNGFTEGERTSVDGSGANGSFLKRIHVRYEVGHGISR
jgi:hypothetical protein